MIPYIDDFKDTLFKASVVVNPTTFEPIVHVTSSVNFELLQDLRAHFAGDDEVMNEFIGQCFAHVVSKTLPPDRG